MFTMIDIYGYHSILDNTFTEVSYFSSYGFWLSALMMEFGIWLQIVLDEKKMDMSNSWMKAIAFAAVLSIVIFGVISVLVPILWITNVEDVLNITAIVVGLLIVLVIITGTFSGLGVRLKMMKHGFRDYQIKNQTNMVILVSVILFGFLLLTIIQSITINLGEYNSFVQSQHFLLYNIFYRLFDLLLVYLITRIISGKPSAILRTLQGKSSTNKSIYSTRTHENTRRTRYGRNVGPDESKCESEVSSSLVSHTISSV
eukprot:TRINITY_DN3749_c0_g1_i1.p1 TRINITY_DN3749_c0_g1~~TRINITY_DN3749_c0_g1_i1.p1  ORF type:complete len:257 (-),score=39.69 TRINITY_DN3749_c0_g1_i1:51-821(-)